MSDKEIIIVNDKDEIIGYKDRKLVRDDEICRVTGLWLENDKGEILLAQRALDKRYGPGKWGPACSGTVEEGETYDENIYKEAREEIGLEGIKFKQGPKKLVQQSHFYFAKWYFAKVNKKIEEFKIDKKEVEAIRWISLDNLKKEV
jgi:isopentenyldiphosphate isomerase